MNISFRSLLVMLFLTLQGIQPCIAELSETQIKTAYIFNFIKFTEWPRGSESTDGKINLCVLGNSELSNALNGLKGAKVDGRDLQVLRHNYNTDDLNACQVLFIGNSEQPRVTSIIKTLGDAPVLSISEIDDFAEKGGGIGLLYRDNKIVFEVNLASIQKSRLHLPAQLLNLAFNVFRK